MNLKLNNEVHSLPRSEPLAGRSAIKEERRRTGRYIAILVGISLLVLALYQAWVRRIPVLASLIVPALIMFVYIAWVLFTASRDKRNKARDLERRALEDHISIVSPTLPLEPADDQPVSKIDTNIQHNNCTAPVSCEKIPLHRILQPAKSFNNITSDTKYCPNAADGLKQKKDSFLNVNEDKSHKDTMLIDNVVVKPTILVNDVHVETNGNTEDTEAGVGNYKHEKLKRDTIRAVFRRSYSIA